MVKNPTVGRRNKGRKKMVKKQVWNAGLKCRLKGRFKMQVERQVERQVGLVQNVVTTCIYLYSTCIFNPVLDLPLNLH